MIVVLVVFGYWCFECSNLEILVLVYPELLFFIFVFRFTNSLFCIIWLFNNLLQLLVSKFSIIKFIFIITDQLIKMIWFTDTKFNILGLIIIKWVVDYLIFEILLHKYPKLISSRIKINLTINSIDSMTQFKHHSYQSSKCISVVFGEKEYSTFIKVKMMPIAISWKLFRSVKKVFLTNIPPTRHQTDGWNLLQ